MCRICGERAGPLCPVAVPEMFARHTPCNISTAATPYCSLYPPPAALANVPTSITLRIPRGETLRATLIIPNNLRFVNRYRQKNYAGFRRRGFMLRFALLFRNFNTVSGVRLWSRAVRGGEARGWRFQSKNPFPAVAGKGLVLLVWSYVARNAGRAVSKVTVSSPTGEMTVRIAAPSCAEISTSCTNNTFNPGGGLWSVVPSRRR